MNRTLATAIVAIVVLSEVVIVVPIRADATTNPCSPPGQLSSATNFTGPTATPTPAPHVQLHAVLASPTPTPAHRFIMPPITCVPVTLTVENEYAGGWGGYWVCPPFGLSLSMTANGLPFWTGQGPSHLPSCQVTFAQLPTGVPLHYKVWWAPGGTDMGGHCTIPGATTGTFTIPRITPQAVLFLRCQFRKPLGPLLLRDSARHGIAWNVVHYI
jgi:hypothetical protein